MRSSYELRAIVEQAFVTAGQFTRTLARHQLDTQRYTLGLPVDLVDVLTAGCLDAPSLMPTGHTVPDLLQQPHVTRIGDEWRPRPPHQHVALQATHDDEDPFADPDPYGDDAGMAGAHL